MSGLVNGGASAEAIAAIVAEAVRQTRPAWYERAPWSWGIGAALAVATSVIGDGVTHALGW